eukprot:gene2683-3102_t
MEKRIINPWKWQDQRSYVQAVEVKNVESTLYISGQTAINADGLSSAEDMKSQLLDALRNLEQVVTQAGYRCGDIVRLNIYTTSTAELWPHFPVFQDWIATHGIKQALTLLEVKSLFETLKVELEATLVNPEQDEPKALAEESSSMSIKRMYDVDLTENLYGEITEKIPELKQLEEQIERLRKAQEDSTKVFAVYIKKNELYYSSARQHMESIRDSVLKQKTRKLIESSQEKYRLNISRQQELLKMVMQKMNALNDLNESLKINKTIPLIEKYQKEKKPSVKAIEGFSKQLDQVLKLQDSLTKKHEAAMPR